MDKKKYAAAEQYESKLKKVMCRMEAELTDYDWGRSGAFVQFMYSGLPYRFEHSVENANKHGIKIYYGSDCFAQIVLALEDFARMKERGIYDLARLLEGFKALPEAKTIAPCLIALGFVRPPTSAELDKRYRELCKVVHPDAGGDVEHFVTLTRNYDEATRLLEEES